MIKLFVGTDPNGDDAESMMVLEYSARKHCSQPLDIVWMRMSDDPNSFWNGWDASEWATPFSGFRWAIPEYCNYEGQAIYMDSDMMILSDLNNLWKQKFRDDPRAVVMAKGGEDTWRFCVCMWDCYMAKNHITPVSEMKTDPYAHRKMMGYFSENFDRVQPFKGNWNCLDGEDKKIEDIDILHYTDMSTQFHHKYVQKRYAGTNYQHWFDGEIRPHWRKDLQELFDKMYNEALEAGYKVENYIPDHRIEYEKQSQAGYGSRFVAHKWSK